MRNFSPVTGVLPDRIGRILATSDVTFQSKLAHRCFPSQRSRWQRMRVLPRSKLFRWSSRWAKTVGTFRVCNRAPSTGATMSSKFERFRHLSDRCTVVYCSQHAPNFSVAEEVEKGAPHVNLARHRFCFRDCAGRALTEQRIFEAEIKRSCLPRSSGARSCRRRKNTL